MLQRRCTAPVATRRVALRACDGARATAARQGERVEAFDRGRTGVRARHGGRSMGEADRGAQRRQACREALSGRRARRPRSGARVLRARERRGRSCGRVFVVLVGPGPGAQRDRTPVDRAGCEGAGRARCRRGEGTTRRRDRARRRGSACLCAAWTAVARNDRDRRPDAGRPQGSQGPHRIDASRRGSPDRAGRAAHDDDVRRRAGGVEGRQRSMRRKARSRPSSPRGSTRSAFATW